MNAWQWKIQQRVNETKLIEGGSTMSVLEWTVFNLMTDTAVLEQARYTNDDVKAIMLQLERKLDAIIARESSYVSA